jgi:DNA invertase Pin-like site-specific DNA recombinase
LPRRRSAKASIPAPSRRLPSWIRVSTSKQETSNQRRELQAVAERSGWQIVKVYEDAGISGAKGREKRPGLDAMLKAVNAKEFDMVATWSVDRLGRSLTDLLSILQCLRDKHVDLFLHQQGLDTSTTAGRAMFQMLGVFAEFERGIIRERINAGLARGPGPTGPSWADVRSSRRSKPAFVSCVPRATASSRSAGPSASVLPWFSGW